MTTEALTTADRIAREAALSRQLTPHFRVADFAVSAVRPDLVRPVPLELLGSLIQVADLLEVIGFRINRPIKILSGYRSPALNRAEDGEKTSQHVMGQAADWTCTWVRDAMDDVCALASEGLLDGAGQIVYYPHRQRVHLALASLRYDKPTLCVHWPEHGWKYRPITPSRVALAQLVPRLEAVDVS